MLRVVLNTRTFSVARRADPRPLSQVISRRGSGHPPPLDRRGFVFVFTFFHFSGLFCFLHHTLSAATLLRVLFRAGTASSEHLR